MPNKKLLLLLVVFAVASCSSNKKNNDADTKPVSVKQEPSKVAVEENIEDTTMFSVTADELKKSESGPQVVYFDTNSSKLDGEATDTLKKKVLPEAKNLKTKKVVIEAHCDERGSEAYNQKLSERRAKSVKRYLVKNGVSDVKIKTVGYGESKPVALGHDEESWSKNRRAVTISIKK